MLRAVLDPGVLVSGLIVAEGSAGRIVDHWRQGEFELVVSDALLTELEEVLRRPRLATRVDSWEASGYVSGLRRAALPSKDPPAEPGLTPDPDDDYLVTLAHAGAGRRDRVRRCAPDEARTDAPVLSKWTTATKSSQQSDKLTSAPGRRMM